MKAPSTIPVPHGNLQPAEGKCNLQPATCRRQTPRRPHFALLKVFNFALLLSLTLIACSSEELVDDHGIALREGEQLVNIRLDGLGNAAENVIEELVIYSFVGIAPDGTIYDAAAAESNLNYNFEFTLERKYCCKTGVSDNDMLLTADGNGYSVAIPVQKDNYLRRFMVKVNAGYASNFFVAVPVFQSDGITLNDRTGATVICTDNANHSHSGYILATDRVDLQHSLGVPISPIHTPLPASANAVWREELTGGYFKTHDIFAAADLAKGLTATLTRKVARFDINNPATTGFTVTGISADSVDQKQCFLFDGNPTEANRSNTELKTLSLANATFIPAALYIPNGYYSDTKLLDIVIHGTFHGVDTELHAKTGNVNGNTRYIINIINSGSTVAASLSLADWTDSGANIDSDDLYGRLNSGASLSIPRKGYDSYISKTDNVITVSYNATSYENPFPGINIAGAENDTLPVGIIIPDGVKWLAIDKTSENTSQNYTVTVNVVAKNIERASEAYEGKQYDKSIPPYTPPRETTLTLVTNTDGKNIHHEYRVVQDWIFPNSILLSTELARGNFVVPEGCTFDQNTRTITLPPFQKGYLYYTGDAVAGILKDQSWLHTQREYTRVNLNANDNFQSTSDRSVTLTLRIWDEALNDVITEDYTITQTAGNFDPALLTTGVTVNTTTLTGITVNSGAVTIPDNYNSGTTNPSYSDALLLVGEDEKGFIATVTPGQNWLWLEVPLETTMQNSPAHGGKYIRRIRVDNNSTGTFRTADINILYRDTDGNIARKTIRITQGAGGGTI